MSSSSAVADDANADDGRAGETETETETRPASGSYRDATDSDDENEEHNPEGESDFDPLRRFPDDSDLPAEETFQQGAAETAADADLDLDPTLLALLSRLGHDDEDEHE